MAWFEDLTPYSYSPWYEMPDRGLPLNVGWLEYGMPFPTATPEPAFADRLRLLIVHARSHATRGDHCCDICPPIPNEDLKRLLETPCGSSEIRALGSDGQRFAAPELIAHYVESHQYAPPRPFVDAVMRCASLTPEAAALSGRCLSCGTRIGRHDKLDFPGSPGFVQVRCSGCGTTFSPSRSARFIGID